MLRNNNNNQKTQQEDKKSTTLSNYKRNRIFIAYSRLFLLLVIVGIMLCDKIAFLKRYISS